MFDQDCGKMTRMELGQLYAQMRNWVNDYDREHPEENGEQNRLSQVLQKKNLDRNVLNETPYTAGNGNNFQAAIREVLGQKNQYVFTPPPNETQYGQSYMKHNRRNLY